MLDGFGSSCARGRLIVDLLWSGPFGQREETLQVVKSGGEWISSIDMENMRLGNMNRWKTSLGFFFLHSHQFARNLRFGALARSLRRMVVQDPVRFHVPCWEGGLSISWVRFPGESGSLLDLLGLRFKLGVPRHRVPHVCVQDRTKKFR